MDEVNGVGIDVVSVERVKRLLERNSRVRDFLFHPLEVEYCERVGGMERFCRYAGRWAAKEALWKALGRRINPRKIAVLSEGKEPRFLLELPGVNAENFLVSISHDGGVAVAVVFKRGNK